MSTLKLRHCSKLNIAPKVVVSYEMQRYEVLYKYEMNFLVSLVKRKFMHIFSLSIIDNWNLSFIEIKNKPDHYLGFINKKLLL